MLLEKWKVHTNFIVSFLKMRANQWNHHNQKKEACHPGHLHLVRKIEIGHCIMSRTIRHAHLIVMEANVILIIYSTVLDQWLLKSYLKCQTMRKLQRRVTYPAIYSRQITFESNLSSKYSTLRKFKWIKTTPLKTRLSSKMCTRKTS